jgi:hypothetical protein
MCEEPGVFTMGVGAGLSLTGGLNSYARVSYLGSYFICSDRSLRKRVEERRI